MRFANLGGRMVIVVDGGAIDVATASGGRFGPEPAACYESWADFVGWAAGATGTAEPYDPALLGAPSPAPRQSYGIGLNYSAHAAEANAPHPEFPPTFTKFPTCITGPYADVELPTEFVDHEIELVVVIGTYAYRVSRQDAWSHVAGLTVGQDITERVVQKRPPAPQFCLGKSFPGFGPTGPVLVTPDEFANPDDLALSCSVNGVTMQSSRTGDLIFSVPQLIEMLSDITPMLPGDVIFTGTPSGVGSLAKPPRFLKAGDQLVSTIEGIGSMTTTFVARR